MPTVFVRVFADSPAAAGDDDDLDIEQDPASSPPSPELVTPMLVPSPYPTYLSLFRRRPRIRFNGCYISTVNYTRPGASSPLAISWNTPLSRIAE